MVTLARAFGLQTVAEGVEDADALRVISELGVDFAQGYYIARPAPLDTLATVVSHPVPDVGTTIQNKRNEP